MINLPGAGELASLDENLNKLKSKISFPASKEEITKVMDDSRDIPGAATNLVKSNLPKGTYSSIDEVKKRLGV